MALAEKVVKEHITKTPERYARRVRGLALIYFALNALSVVIIVTIAWRVQFFVTLSQRSNVETLTLAIIFVLAIYYLITTSRGFVGALRILWLNSPAALARGEQARERVEHRKHSALKTGGESKFACFDREVRLRGKPDEPIKWELADAAGKLGELELEGVKITYYPLKAGMNDSIFEFLADRLEGALRKQDPEAKLQIVQWSTIDEDQASTYYCMVEAFRNLETQLGNKGPIWPAWEITQEHVEEVGQALDQLVPALRNESLLPNLEYEVEYTVPVIPEPLGFLRLTRRDTRADPLISVGCAGLAMLFIMLLLTFFILLPPWLPGK